MLAKTKLAKLEKQLEELQAGREARLLTMEQIEKAIARAEGAVKEIIPELRPAVKFQYHPHDVANAYRYSAFGTELRVTFSKTGKAISAEVLRTYTIAAPRVRLSFTTSEIERYISEELGIERPSYYSDDAARYEKLEKLVYKASGFRPTGYRNLYLL